MSYRAIKPCRFAGRDFRVGEIVPEALLAPGAKKRLLSMGILASGDEPAAPAPKPQPTRKAKPKADEGKAGEGK